MGRADKEIQGIQNTLKVIEQNDLFARDARRHLVRRHDQAESEQDDVQDNNDDGEEEEIVELMVQEAESRGWKNGGKKKKKDKKNKRVEEAVTEPELETRDEMKDMQVLQQNSVSTSSHEDAVMMMKEKQQQEEDPFTSGIQFSAYSGETRPTYKPARASASRPSLPPPENRFMYGLDRDGKPQYMDEAAVSVLLQNPQAKKVINKTG
jgi:hypothetical protein